MTIDWRTDEHASVLSHRDKGVPLSADGLTISQFLALSPQLADLWTPILTLSDSALRHNVATMSAWCDSHGFSLAPHGKTTMAPSLWQRQLDAGALAITLATVGQVRTARSLGFSSILLANAATDPRGLRFLAQELHDPEFRFSCWADSVQTVEAMEAALTGVPLPRPIDVCVELGATGGRTGARSLDDARLVAARIRDSSVLRLAGVAGYEGALAHDRSPEALEAVRRYLASMVELHASLEKFYDDGEVLLTAGGSAFFDLVAEVFAPIEQALPRTRYVLRSGAYVTHDDGFYRGISPLDPSYDAELPQEGRLIPAMRAYARVVSQPEAGLALLDAGKRDLPFDEGLPEPIAVASELGSEGTPFRNAAISAMNDQHSFLRIPEDSTLSVGAVVMLGVSHPCTAFDKWRYLPVIGADGSTVIDLIRTYF